MGKWIVPSFLGNIKLRCNFSGILILRFYRLIMFPNIAAGMANGSTLYQSVTYAMLDQFDLV